MERDKRQEKEAEKQEQNFSIVSYQLTPGGPRPVDHFQDFDDIEYYQN